MNRQDVVNTIFNHYIDNYDMRTAVDACEFLGVKSEEIETANRFWEIGNGVPDKDPDEEALCKCGHPKSGHDHQSWFCNARFLCDCKNFQYKEGADEPWAGSGTTAPE